MEHSDWGKVKGIPTVHVDQANPDTTTSWQIPSDNKGTNNSEQTNISEDNKTLFAKSNANQEIFVSNAEQAVMGIPMEKATPQQFKKWFGDWEIVARANAIRNLTPVDVSKYSMTGTPEESYIFGNATNKIDGTKVKFDRAVFTMYSLRTSTYTKNPSSMLRLPIQTLGRGWSMEGFPKQS